ncbi:MAG TPA: ABC transporter ATP-binding protein [Candidatus Saccharimonadia bacterium]|nr:ABC transporter ATP-binding protein [Candidatus Saccharimonadia bacterium]
MNAVVIKDVTKRFGLKRALQGINLTVPAGSIYGFLGPNGAGKTTTIRCLMDFIRPSSGTIEVFGRDSRLESAAIKRQVGFLSADSQLYLHWSAAQHIGFYRQARGAAPDAQKLLHQLELPANVPVKNLSSGNRQKLGFVLALMHRPQLLVLDEPTRALDPLLQEEIYELLRRFRAGGGTVFFSSHNLAEVEKLCDEVGIIRQGKMVASESMQAIRDLKVHMVRAVFAKPVATKELVGAGVQIISSQGNTVIAKVHGDLTAFMAKVSRHDLSDLEVSRPSLEEVFMEFYR